MVEQRSHINKKQEWYQKIKWGFKKLRLKSSIFPNAWVHLGMDREKCKNAGHFPLMEVWFDNYSSFFILFIPQRTHQNLCHHIIFISIIILWTKGTEILLLPGPYWLTQHKTSCFLLWLTSNSTSLIIPSARTTFYSSGYIKKLGFKSHQAHIFQGWGNTYHKSIVWKPVSSLKVFHEVSTPVIWISPRHRGTNWANLWEINKKKPQQLSASTFILEEVGQRLWKTENWDS